MAYKRISVRVPIDGTATLKSTTNTHVGVKTRDISAEGFGVEQFPGEIDSLNYQVEVTLNTGVKLHFTGKLVKHQNSSTTGFMIVDITDEDRSYITKLVEEYQKTDDFVRQVGDYEILPQSFIDEDGTELDITFEDD